MKLINALGISVAMLAMMNVTSHAAGLSLNFASTAGSTIQFNGTNSSFQFNNSNAGNQWQVGSESGGISAIGLFGLVNNGPFSYDTVSTISFGGHNYESADVLGPLGGLVIQDGSGFNLTGNVNWVQLDTFDYAGGINASLMINVTGLAYAGSNPDLQAVVANNPAAMNVTFQFSPGMDLNALTSGAGPYATSYSGSISSVPEPATAACLLLGLGVFAYTRRSRK